MRRKPAPRPVSADPLDDVAYAAGLWRRVAAPGSRLEGGVLRGPGADRVCANRLRRLVALAAEGDVAGAWTPVLVDGWRQVLEREGLV